VATCFRLLNWVACSQSRLHRLQQDPIGSPTRSLPCPVLLFFFQFADSRMEETHKSAPYVALAAAAALGQSLQVSVLLDSPTLEWNGILARFNQKARAPKARGLHSLIEPCQYHIDRHACVPMSCYMGINPLFFLQLCFPMSITWFLICDYLY
jgi:hypothetical protein